MSVKSYLIEHGGVHAGYALSLGERFMFHTSRSDLAAHDGECFDTVDAVRVAIARALAPGADKRRRLMQDRAAA